RQPADGRPRIYVAADARCLCFGHHAVLHHALPQHLRALHRAQIPGAVRMTDIVSPVQGVVVSKAPERRDIGLKRRYAAERRFRAYGVAAISFGFIFLALLLANIVSKGYTAFQQTAITLPIEFSEKVLDPNNKRAMDPSVLVAANY